MNTDPSLHALRTLTKQSHRNLGFNRALLLPVIGAVLAMNTVAPASTVTWTTLTGTANSNTEAFTSGSNWSTGAAPGSADTAYFSGPFTYTSGTIGTYKVAVTGTQSLGSIIYGPITTTNVNITGGTLLLSSGGSVVDQNPISASQYLSSAVLIAPSSSTANGSYTFSSSGFSRFRVSGGVSGGATSGAITINLAGDCTAANEVALISDGNATGGVSLVKAGTGVWYLSGTNTYSGNTTVNDGKLVLAGTVGSSANTVLNAGTLQLDWSGTTSLIGNTKPLTNMINSASSLVIGGAGNLVLTGSASAANSQTFNGTTLKSGAAANISVSAGTGGSVVLNLGSITRYVGSTTNFSIGTSGTVTTTTANTAGSILGGWATVGGTGWAVSAGNGSTAGAITALSSYTNDTWAAGNNTAVTKASTLGTFATTNSLLFTSGNTVTLASTGTTVITSGGILKSSAVGSGGAITGGTLTSGNGKDLIVHNYSVNGIVINSVIADNGSTSIGLTTNGGNVYLGGNSTYTGVTYIAKGWLLQNTANALPMYTTVAFGTAPSGSANALSLNGNNLTIGALGSTAQTTSGNGGTVAVYNGGSASGTVTLTIGGKTYVSGALANTDSTFGGVIADTSTGAINTGTALALTKTGAGSTLTLTGANSYSGPTSVQSGVLAFNSLASATNAQALGSGSVVNIGLDATSSGTLQYTGAAGTLDKNIYALGNGLNTVKNSGSGLLTLSGSLVKNGTILVLNGGSNGINVNGVISGSNASYNSDLYVTGGSVTLSAANTYYGSTWVYGGGVLVNGAANVLPTNTALVLGGTSGGTDNSSNTYNLNGSNQTIASLSGTGTGTQTVTNGSANTTSTLTVTGGGTFNGGIVNGSGTTALTVSGGNLVLGGGNDYTGATAVTGGTLTVNGSLAAGSAVSVTAATLAGSGNANGTVSVTSGTINGSGLSIGATTLNGSSTLSGHNIASSVTVNGGTTSLTGTTQATSGLSVSAGATLNANGTIAGSANVSGLLSGNSTVTNNLTLTSGTLATGNSAGITTVGGNFTMNHTSTLVAEVSGAVAGTSYDQVKVSGNVSIDGTLDLTKLSGLTLGNTITLIDNTGNGTTTGYFSTILTSGSTYTATSNSSYTFAVDGTEYLLSYSSVAGSDGYSNDVTLTVVPEPSTWAMLLGGLGALVGLKGMARRKQD